MPLLINRCCDGTNSSFLPTFFYKRSLNFVLRHDSLSFPTTTSTTCRHHASSTTVAATAAAPILAPPLRLPPPPVRPVKDVTPVSNLPKTLSETTVMKIRLRSRTRLKTSRYRRSPRHRQGLTKKSKSRGRRRKVFAWRRSGNRDFDSKNRQTSSTLWLWVDQKQPLAASS